jgi:hypothetical protein
LLQFSTAVFNHHKLSAFQAGFQLIPKGLGDILGGFNHRSDELSVMSPEGTAFKIKRALQIYGKEIPRPFEAWQ